MANTHSTLTLIALNEPPDKPLIAAPDTIHAHGTYEWQISRAARRLFATRSIELGRRGPLTDDLVTVMMEFPMTKTVPTAFRRGQSQPVVAWNKLGQRLSEDFSALTIVKQF